MTMIIDGTNGVTFPNTTVQAVAGLPLTGGNLSGSIAFTASNAGITFNNSNALTNSQLNDYEMGTFTPSFTSAGGTNPTIAYSVQQGTYTKIGNTVFVSIRLNTSSVSGGSGNLQISGLPFTTSGAATVLWSLPQGFVYNWTISPVASFINPGSATVAMYSSTIGNTQSTVAGLGGACYFSCSGSYTATF